MGSGAERWQRFQNRAYRTFWRYTCMLSGERECGLAAQVLVVVDRLSASLARDCIKDVHSGSRLSKVRCYSLPVLRVVHDAVHSRRIPHLISRFPAPISNSLSILLIPQPYVTISQSAKTTTASLSPYPQNRHP